MFVISVDGEVCGEYNENGERAQHMLVMKGNADSFLRANEVHNPTVHSPTGGGEVTEEEAQAVISELLKFAETDWQKLQDIKLALASQGVRITEDTMWAALLKDCKLHKRPMPTRKPKPKDPGDDAIPVPTENFAGSPLVTHDLGLRVQDPEFGSTSGVANAADNGVGLAQTSSMEVQADGDSFLGDAVAEVSEGDVTQLMDMMGMDADTARDCLRANNGNLNAVLDAFAA